MDFSQKLKQLMDERNISAYKLARDVSCSQTSVRNWLSNARTPQPRTVLMLCDYFGVSEDEMMGREENVQKNNPDTDSDAEAQEFYKNFSSLPESMRSKLLELSTLYLRAESTGKDSE